MNQPQKSNYNLSDLTKVAFENVNEATRLAKKGYSNELRDTLDARDVWTRGWFSEGIAQGLYFHDLKKQNEFVDSLEFIEDGLSQDCKTAAYVGMGLAIAHTGVFSESLYSKLNSRERPWVFDGIGFYKLMIAEQQHYKNMEIPGFVNADAERVNAFYAGAGRALWFAIGENQIDTLIAAVLNFPEELQSPVWRGIGFASTYAGGSSAALQELIARANEGGEHLRIGCFTAILGQGQGDVAHREAAAQAFLGLSIDEVVARSSALLDHRETPVPEPTSTEWASKIQDLLSH